MKREISLRVLVSLVIASLILAACAKTEEAEDIEKVVTKVVKETVKETVVVETEKEEVVTATLVPVEETVTPVATETVEEVDVTDAQQNCFVPNHVLITGPRGDFTAITDHFGGRLSLLKEFPFNYLGNFLNRMDEDEPKSNLLRYFPPEAYGNLVTNLYRITDGTSVISVINEIYMYMYAPDKEKLFFADPNYLIGHPEIRMKGSHWAAFGSPNAGKSSEALAEDFATQWAFDHINLSSAEGKDLSGANVLIGVFDTFPDIPLESEFVDIEYPDPNPINNISDHGPFVAGLVQGVAPGSTITKHRVLDEYGVGTLDVLIQELDEFLDTVANTSDLKGAVINLSLGLHYCPEMFEGFDLTKPWFGIQSLQERLVAAHRSNIVVVAASGNNSEDTPDIPAQWDVTIGVAASSKNREKACFSNRGDILAPGGEGASTGNCVPALAQCAGQGPNQGPNCEFGLISQAPSSNTGYAYWAGTSFAAPLVSGLAALTFEAFDPSETGWRASNEVKGAIECGAYFYSSSGVINADAILQEVEGVEGTPPLQCALRDTMVFSGELFNDPRVTKAVLHAIDWGELLTVTNYLPASYPTDYPPAYPTDYLPAYLWVWDWDRDQPRSSKLSDQDVAAKQMPYDLEEAKGLLDEAAWQDMDGDGIREAHNAEGVEDGAPLSFSILVRNDQPYLYAAYAISDMMAAIGAEVGVEDLPSNESIIQEVIEAAKNNRAAVLYLSPCP